MLRGLSPETHEHDVSFPCPAIYSFPLDVVQWLNSLSLKYLFTDHGNLGSSPAESKGHSFLVPQGYRRSSRICFCGVFLLRRLHAMDARNTGVVFSWNQFIIKIESRELLFICSSFPWSSTIEAGRQKRWPKNSTYPPCISPHLTGISGHSRTSGHTLLQCPQGFSDNSIGLDLLQVWSQQLQEARTMFQMWDRSRGIGRKHTWFGHQPSTHKLPSIAQLVTPCHFWSRFRTRWLSY